MSSADTRIRSMLDADIPAAVALSAAAFDIDLADPDTRERWRLRIGHTLTVDPGGAFVAEHDGRVIGVAEVLRRERLWVLSLLTVDPAAQSHGAGRLLFQRALQELNGFDAGLIVSSDDPRALRLYGLGGFALEPTFCATGAVQRRELPKADPAIVAVREDQLEALEPISRAVRGAPFTPELRSMMALGWQVNRLAGRGFYVAGPDRGLWALSALDDEAATALLWHALAHTGDAEEPGIRWITGRQPWAIDVALRAGLRLHGYGAIAVRGCPGSMRAYLPSPAFA